MKRTKRLLLVALAVGAGVPLRADADEARAPRRVLVELFTSQG
jgi:hypothetical protein